MLLTNLSEPWVSHLLNKMISFLKIILFIYFWLYWLFTAAWAFLLLRSTGFRVSGLGSCSSWTLEHRLYNCGPRGMWDLPRPGIKPLSPVLVGEFFTTEPPGKPSFYLIWCEGSPSITTDKEHVQILSALWDGGECKSLVDLHGTCLGGPEFYVWGSNASLSLWDLSSRMETN